MVSVDSTVDIPRRLPNREASVLLPVPDVPDSKIMIFFFCSIKMLIIDLVSYRLDRRQYRNL